MRVREKVDNGWIDLAGDAVVGRGVVAAELPRLPSKRELRGRVRRCLMFG